MLCPENIKSIFGIGAALLGGGAMFYFARRSRARRLELLRALEITLGGKAEGNLLEMWFSCTAGGRPASLRFVLGGENEDSSLLYTVDCQATCKLRAGPRRALAKAADFVAGLREVPSGDQPWDAKYAVSAGDEMAARRFAADPAVRVALAEAHALGFERFTAGKGKASLEKYYSDEAAELEPERVRKVLALLASLAGRL